MKTMLGLAPAPEGGAPPRHPNIAPATRANPRNRDIRILPLVRLACGSLTIESPARKHLFRATQSSPAVECTISKHPIDQAGAERTSLRGVPMRPPECCGPSDPTRRDFMRAGGLAGLGLFWADWMRAEAAQAAPRKKGKAKSVI